MIPRDFNAAVHFVERHVRGGRGDRVAYVHDEGTVTYAALAERTARVATALRRAGALPEQRVLLCMQDTPDFVAAFFGALRAGVVPVPLNTLLTTEDYRYFIADSRARLILVSEPLATKLEAALTGLSETDAPRLVVGLDGAAPMREACAVTCDDVAFWLYSSGSTGRPKRAVHLHSHLVHTAELYGAGVKYPRWIEFTEALPKTAIGKIQRFKLRG